MAPRPHRLRLLIPLFALLALQEVANGLVLMPQTTTESTPLKDKEYGSLEENNIEHSKRSRRQLTKASILKLNTSSNKEMFDMPKETIQRILQDYSPTANERSTFHKPGHRKLLQDYTPTSNNRSPSHKKSRNL